MLANIPYSVYKQDKVCINSRLAAADDDAATDADDVVAADGIVVDAEADTVCTVNVADIVDVEDVGDVVVSVQLI